MNRRTFLAAVIGAAVAPKLLAVPTATVPQQFYHVSEIGVLTEEALEAALAELGRMHDLQQPLFIAPERIVIPPHFYPGCVIPLPEYSDPTAWFLSVKP